MFFEEGADATHAERPREVVEHAIAHRKVQRRLDRVLFDGPRENTTIPRRVSRHGRESTIEGLETIGRATVSSTTTVSSVRTVRTV
ncbi:MAG: hypothetical protein CMI16_06760 [Opitutaceae bacterium]|nr:hypothetical protein [Opitutaceae bacterium]